MNLTQVYCLRGSGLVYVTRSGGKLTRPRKCWNCGGFLPWLGWKRFFLTSLFDFGNGGALQRPAKDYEETNMRWKSMEEDYDGNLKVEDDEQSTRKT